MCPEQDLNLHIRRILQPEYSASANSAIRAMFDIHCIFCCGEGEIRTLGKIALTTVFETGPFNHSGTSPYFFLRQISNILPLCLLHNKFFRAAIEKCSPLLRLRLALLTERVQLLTIA